VLVDYDIFELGDFTFQKGATLRGAKLAYKSFGTLNAARDNAIVYPTWYSGQHYDNEWLVGQGMALDPEKYFIIIPNMFGNGLSSSPSNTPEPCNAARFPKVTAYDNVRAQHRLVTERFGITHLKMVLGWSMGAMQTFHWGSMYPDMMDFLVPFCGSAKCSRHNFVFLEGVKAALTADAAFKEGWYTENVERGLRAAARVYAGWGFSQTFYRQQLDIEALGYSSLEDFLIGFWEGPFLLKDPNDLLAMLWTWQNGDIAANELYNGDLNAALGAIIAKTLVMPGLTDLYFPPEDSQNEVAGMPNAEYLPIPSVWGHFAGGPGTNPIDVQFLDNALKGLLGGESHEPHSVDRRNAPFDERSSSK
jgi:homoserine O-acetyltransferase